MHPIIKSLAVLILITVVNQAPAQLKTSDIPTDILPTDVGNKVARRFLAKPYLIFGKTIGYPEVCTWYGALNFAQLTGNKELEKQLIARFEPLRNEKKLIVPSHGNVDFSVFGAVPLQLYQQTKHIDFLTIGLEYAHKQWTVPDTLTLTPELNSYIAKGHSWQTRLWIDDMYMIIMLQVQAYRATQKNVYLDRAAKEMVFYLEQLQKPNGLFYHAPDVPFFWGRGNGWMAAGMTEILRSLPSNHPDRSRILLGYRTMMAGLLKYQSAEGSWRQLIDDKSSWQESSSTGMFTYALISGVRNKWLEEKVYAPAALKGWIALNKFINADGDVREVCIGTNKKNDRQYYLDRERITGDLHGQAPVLWCTMALLAK